MSTPVDEPQSGEKTKHLWRIVREQSRIINALQNLKIDGIEFTGKLVMGSGGCTLFIERKNANLPYT